MAFTLAARTATRMCAGGARGTNADGCSRNEMPIGRGRRGDVTDGADVRCAARAVRGAIRPAPTAAPLAQGWRCSSKPLLHMHVLGLELEELREWLGHEFVAATQVEAHRVLGRR